MMRSQGLWYSRAFLFAFFPVAVDFLLQVESLFSYLTHYIPMDCIYQRCDLSPSNVPQVLSRPLEHGCRIKYMVYLDSKAPSYTSGDKIDRTAMRTKSLSLRVTMLCRFNLGVKSLFFACDKRDLSVLASSIEQKDVIDSR